MTPRLDPELLRRIERQLVDQGKLVEAGWVGLRLTAYPDEPAGAKVDRLREAFFAGAQHLFSSLMGIMDEDAEPTAADLKRMDLISAELDGFIRDFEKHHGLGARP
jgi:hypothetical protein